MSEYSAAAVGLGLCLGFPSPAGALLPSSGPASATGSRRVLVLAAGGVGGASPLPGVLPFVFVVVVALDLVLSTFSSALLATDSGGDGLPLALSNMEISDPADAKGPVSMTSPPRPPEIFALPPLLAKPSVLAALPPVGLALRLAASVAAIRLWLFFLAAIFPPGAADESKDDDVVMPPPPPAIPPMACCCECSCTILPSVTAPPPPPALPLSALPRTASVAAVNAPLSNALLPAPSARCCSTSTLSLRKASVAPLSAAAAAALSDIISLPRRRAARRHLW
ncbi:hypothetical protein CCMA1212_008657 [Trichoderma ghanense]|uniref:Uncharacterized protein n=1 Tax=Trichoderma ghanense TaxID=65468 RepID=A0ABY2GW34_9HYPO